MKGLDCDQTPYPVFVAPTFRMIVSIYATYHLTIGIMDVTNALHNKLKASSEREIIDFPHHYLSWFKFRLPNIRIEPAPDGRCVMVIWRGM